MITSVVAAIAISQREARRKQREQEEEAAEAAKKSILVTSASTVGLLAALFCRAQHFTVTICDGRPVEEFDSEERGVVVLARTALRVLGRCDEALGGKLEEAAVGCDHFFYRRAKSAKKIGSAPLGLDDALIFAAEDLHAVLASFTTSQVRQNTQIVSYHDAPEDLDGPVPIGRPYALSNTGEKFYADCIISVDALGRTHVLETAGETGNYAAAPTGWSAFSGVVEAPETSLDETRDSASVFIHRFSALTAIEKLGDTIFTLLHPSSTLPSQLLPKYNHVISAPLSDAIETNTAALATLPKPPTLVSRKSRKIVLIGSDAAFRLPPFSPHLEASIHIESLATLAVCLRKASSVPLGLEVFSRLRKPRDDAAWRVAEVRFRAAREAAQEGELEAEEVKWGVDGEEGVGTGDNGEQGIMGEDWWEYEADKEADKGFEGVIEQLTKELLGRQKAAMEAQAKAQAEAEKKEKEEAEIKRRDEEEMAVGEEGEEEAEEPPHSEEETPPKIDKELPEYIPSANPSQPITSNLPPHSKELAINQKPSESKNTISSPSPPHPISKSSIPHPISSSPEPARASQKSLQPPINENKDIAAAQRDEEPEKEDAFSDTAGTTDSEGGPETSPEHSNDAVNNDTGENPCSLTAPSKPHPLLNQQAAEVSDANNQKQRQENETTPAISPPSTDTPAQSSSTSSLRSCGLPRASEISPLSGPPGPSPNHEFPQLSAPPREKPRKVDIRPKFTPRAPLRDPSLPLSPPPVETTSAPSTRAASPLQWDPEDLEDDSMEAITLPRHVLTPDMEPTWTCDNDEVGEEEPGAEEEELEDNELPALPPRPHVETEVLENVETGEKQIVDITMGLSASETGSRSTSTTTTMTSTPTTTMIHGKRELLRSASPDPASSSPRSPVPILVPEAINTSYTPPLSTSVPEPKPSPQSISTPTLAPADDIPPIVREPLESETPLDDDDVHGELESEKDEEKEIPATTTTTTTITTTTATAVEEKEEDIKDGEVSGASEASESVEKEKAGEKEATTQPPADHDVATQTSRSSTGSAIQKTDDVRQTDGKRRLAVLEEGTRTQKNSNPHVKLVTPVDLQPYVKDESDEPVTITAISVGTKVVQPAHPLKDAQGEVLNDYLSDGGAEENKMRNDGRGKEQTRAEGGGGDKEEEEMKKKEKEKTNEEVDEQEAIRELQRRIDEKATASTSLSTTEPSVPGHEDPTSTRASGPPIRSSPIAATAAAGIPSKRRPLQRLDHTPHPQPRPPASSPAVSHASLMSPSSESTSTGQAIPDELSASASASKESSSPSPLAPPPLSSRHTHPRTSPTPQTPEKRADKSRERPRERSRSRAAWRRIKGMRFPSFSSSSSK